jgi:hypothetical protein
MEGCSYSDRTQFYFYPARPGRPAYMWKKVKAHNKSPYMDWFITTQTAKSLIYSSLKAKKRHDGQNVYDCQFMSPIEGFFLFSAAPAITISTWLRL